MPGGGRLGHVSQTQDPTDNSLVDGDVAVTTDGLTVAPNLEAMQATNSIPRACRRPFNKKTKKGTSDHLPVSAVMTY